MNTIIQHNKMATKENNNKLPTSNTTTSQKQSLIPRRRAPLSSNTTMLNNTSSSNHNSVTNTTTNPASLLKLQLIQSINSSLINNATRTQSGEQQENQQLPTPPSTQEDTGSTSQSVLPNKTTTDYAPQSQRRKSSSPRPAPIPSTSTSSTQSEPSNNRRKSTSLSTPKPSKPLPAGTTTVSSTGLKTIWIPWTAPRSRSNSPHPSNVSVKQQSSTATTAPRSSQRRKSKTPSRSATPKLVPTPSRTLDKAPTSPDSDGEDPLLLKSEEGNGQVSARRRKSTGTGGKQQRKKATMTPSSAGQKRAKEDASTTLLSPDHPSSSHVHRSDGAVDDTFIYYEGAKKQRTLTELLAAHKREEEGNSSGEEGELMVKDSGAIVSQEDTQPAREEGEDEEDLGGHDDFNWFADGGGYSSDGDSVQGQPHNLFPARVDDNLAVAVEEEVELVGDEEVPLEEDEGAGSSDDERSTVIGSSPYRERTMDYVVPLAPMSSSPVRPPHSSSPARRNARNSVTASQSPAVVRSSSATVDIPGAWSRQSYHLQEKQQAQPESQLEIELRRPKAEHDEDAELSALSSPGVPPCQPESDSEEEEEADEELVLAGGTTLLLPGTGSRRATLSPTPSFSTNPAQSPAPSSSQLQHQPGSYPLSPMKSSSVVEEEQEDIKMASPARAFSLSISQSQPPPQPSDVRMASPSPARRDPTPSTSRVQYGALRAAARERQSSQEEGDGAVDAQMASPSPARVREGLGLSGRGRNSPTSLDKLKMVAGAGEGSNVQTRKGLLGNKLPFLFGVGATVLDKERVASGGDLFSVGGSAGVILPLPQDEQTPRAGTTAGSTRTGLPAHLSLALAGVSNSLKETSAPTSHTSTFTPQATGSSANDGSFETIGGSHSRTRSSLRKRPSHPTLPVVEISSTDPQAAARAAAILKVYHDYVEQGLPPVSPNEHDGGEEGDEREESDEEADSSAVLKDLLQREERSVLQSAIGPRYSSSSHQSAPSPLVHSQPPHHQRISSVSSRGTVTSLASQSPSRFRPNPTPTPTSSRAVEFGSSPCSGSGSGNGASPVPTNTSLPWNSKDWRRLETAIVDCSRIARREQVSLEVDDVVEEFLENEGLTREDCQGEWKWDKLVIRVQALMQRRAKDAERRASRASSVLDPLPPSLEDEIRSATASASNTTLPTSASVVRPPPVTRPTPLVQVQQSQPHAEEVSESEEEEEDEDEEESEADEQEDTFFERQRPVRVEFRPEDEEGEEDEALAHPPPALATSRFAHLYDEPIAKPPLPSQSWAVKDESSVEYDTSGSVEEADYSTEAFARGGTPEAQSDTASQPSSARKLFNYIGGLVKRAPVADSLTPGREMSQVSRSGVPSLLLATPALASIEKPFPLRPHTERQIRPLPSEIRAASGDTSLSFFKRRRSSGGAEGKVWSRVNALEEAESSREEDARAIDMLKSGVKRRASQADLNPAVRPPPSKVGPFVYGTPIRMVPSGTRALDLPIAGKSRVSRGAAGTVPRV
ncbi:hypothetical protein T439DRAFT_378618 [Meredithblackwellia eburnea MCA 4105]